MSSGTFKKTVIEVTVISDGQWEWDNLTDVAWAISGAACAGYTNEKSVRFLSKLQTARELVKQDRDPALLLGEAWEGWQPGMPAPKEVKNQ